jgi:MFS family permease
MFRWLQGIGGCGILALSQLVFVELVPPAKYPKYIGIVSIAMTAPLVAGPLVGGSISLSGDWRWIFLLK